jgi:hypothetical protein
MKVYFKGKVLGGFLRVLGFSLYWAFIPIEIVMIRWRLVNSVQIQIKFFIA